MASPSDDWIAGFRLLQSRHRESAKLLHAALTSPVDEAQIARSIGPGPIVTTGTGSSAAHARFLASILNEAGLPARFVPMSAFLQPPSSAVSDRTLVVFSQGLSPNARLALSHPHCWHSVWLATAAGADGTGSGDPPGGDAAARRRALDQAVAAGVQVMTYPGADEYGTLLRIVGPMTGYAAALRFAAAACRAGYGNAALPSGARWPDLDADAICRAVEDAPANLQRMAPGLGSGDLDSNLVFIASAPHTERLDNLRLKVLEGTLLPAPPIWDLLDLAHGPFQQLFDKQATLIAFARSGASGEDELLTRLSGMLAADRHRLVRLTSGLPEPLAILEHEAMMNALVLRYVSERRIDAANWPGKGADAPLYSYETSPVVSASAVRPKPEIRRLEDLTWPELETFLARGGRTAILPLGSIEQHGPHLPFATDAWIARELAHRLASRVPEAIELPVLPFGCASEHLGFPGTLSLEMETLAAVLCDVAASVARHGFARLFVFSAHGGNRDALADALPRMRAVAGDLAILAAPGLGAPMELLHGASALHDVSAEASGHHAGEFETSILLGIAARSVRTEKFAPGVATTRHDLDSLFYPDLRVHAPSGTVGDPRAAQGARAEAYLEAWVASLLEIYRRDENWK